MGASKCAACSRPAAEGRKTCETCLANSRRRAAERRRRLGTEAIREAKRVDYQRHRESYLARAKGWATANPDARREIAQRWRAENPEKDRDSRVASKANARARALGVEGELDIASRQAMIDRWGDKCLACGADEVTMDHVIPLADGGLNAVDNLQPLCIDCNRAKNRKTIDYRARVA